jgi:hypothetical protein
MHWTTKYSSWSVFSIILGLLFLLLLFLATWRSPLQIDIQEDDTAR